MRTSVKRTKPRFAAGYIAWGSETTWSSYLRFCQSIYKMKRKVIIVERFIRPTTPWFFKFWHWGWSPYRSYVFLHAHTISGENINSLTLPWSSFLFLLRLLQDLLHDLLFFNQESPNNAILNTASATGTSISTGHVLLWAGDLGIFTRTESRNLSNLESSLVSHGKNQSILFMPLWHFRVLSTYIYMFGWFAVVIS